MARNIARAPRPRDIGRAKLYLAERNSGIWGRDENGLWKMKAEHGGKAFVGEVLDSAIWARFATDALLAQKLAIHIKPNTGYTCATPYGLKLRRDQKDNKWVILHELAHVLIFWISREHTGWYDKYRGHGPEFRRILFLLVREFLGLKKAREFLAYLDWADLKVDWKPFWEVEDDKLKEAA